ncbi:MAG TPA: helix-turn-helix domain-containing protein [Gemmatimonadaceae bacterium]|nr:helix-turn-helix domain-containing protein [Gemmatimonadaceae bacterium]
MTDAILEELRAIRDELVALRRQQAAGAHGLLSAVEAAGVLGCDQERVAGWCLSGEIRAQKDGRIWRIPRTEVERLCRDGLPQPKRRGRPRKAMPAGVDRLAALDLDALTAASAPSAARPAPRRSVG